MVKERWTDLGFKGTEMTPEKERCEFGRREKGICIGSFEVGSPQNEKYEKQRVVTNRTGVYGQGVGHQREFKISEIKQLIIVQTKAEAGSLTQPYIFFSWNASGISEKS